MIGIAQHAPTPSRSRPAFRPRARIALGVVWLLVSDFGSQRARGEAAAPVFANAGFPGLHCGGRTHRGLFTAPCAVSARCGSLGRSRQDSRRSAKAGVCSQRPKPVLRLSPGMVAFTDGQRLLLLSVRREHEPGSVDLLVCRAKRSPHAASRAWMQAIYLASAPPSPRSSRVSRKPSERLAPSRS
jgi:hypothetical protein